MLSVLRLLIRSFQQKAILYKKPDRILALQQSRLRSLIRWAKSQSPFYAEHLRHVDPEKFELSQLPTLTKADMMNNFDSFLTDRQLRRTDLERFMSNPNRLGQWYLGRYALSHTSGTQGMQAIIVQDRSMMELLYALQMMCGNAYTRTLSGLCEGICQGVRLAAITIGRGFYPSASMLAYAPPAFKAFTRRLWLTHIEPLDEVVNQLNRFQPNILLAYANVLEILAREALAGRLMLDRGRPLRQIVNFSEPLSQGARNLIEKAFNLPITNNYAMGECMALTTGCPGGHGMHLQADWAILEVVDRHNRPVIPGQPGDKVLLTNLYNLIQPFIRYEIEDVVTVSPQSCPCGSPLPLILKVEGRTDELLWIRVGDQNRQIHPFVFVDMLDEYPAVGWYQVLQVERNRFLLRAAPAPGRIIDLPGIHEIIHRGLRHYGLADSIHLDVEITNQVGPDPKSGKLKRITSLVGSPGEPSRTGVIA